MKKKNCGKENIAYQHFLFFFPLPPDGKSLISLKLICKNQINVAHRMWFVLLDRKQWGNRRKTVSSISLFHGPTSQDQGYIVSLWSVCTNSTWKLNIFHLFLNQFSYKARVWYEGTSHWYTSAGTKVKLKYWGDTFEKMSIFWDIGVSRRACSQNVV